MEQGIYLFCQCLKNEKEIIKRFETFCKKEAPDAFLLDVKQFEEKEFSNLLQAIQSKETAVLIKEDIDLALRFKADGVQISYTEDLKKIRKKLEDLSLGVLCRSRDEAMRAGEIGADYLAFEGGNALELTAWWLDLFTLPCVNFNLETPSETADFKVIPLID